MFVIFSKKKITKNNLIVLSAFFKKIDVFLVFLKL